MTEPGAIDKALLRETLSTMKSLKVVLEGIALELNGMQKRHYTSTDFLIGEFRRLATTAERVAVQLEEAAKCSPG
jgi:hypothetical protein